MSSVDALNHCRAWFSSQGWTAFPFQIQAWRSYLDGSSGLVNAPTGSGKTYSLLLPAIAEGIERSKTDAASCEGVQLIWITPIRALAKEINQSACNHLKYVFHNSCHLIENNIHSNLAFMISKLKWLQS